MHIGHVFRVTKCVQIQSWIHRHHPDDDNKLLHQLSACACYSNLTETYFKEKPTWKSTWQIQGNNGFRDVKRDVASWNAMLKRYTQHGRLDDARRVFETMPNRNVFSWNVMIEGYSQCERIEDARQLFDKMPERNMATWTAMICGYSQNERLEESRRVFNRMPQRDVISWNAMIAGYVRHGKLQDARRLFDSMPERNVTSWTTMVTGYAQVGKIEDAHFLFYKIPQRDVAAWNAMIAGYSQNNRIEDARHMFDKMPTRNVISWTAIIAGYAQHGLPDEALKLFCQMQSSGMKPNQPTFTSVLSACAGLDASEKGKPIHAHIIKIGTESDTFVASALITVYAKCKTMDDARLMFDSMTNRNMVSWTALITGYAQNGHGEEALQLFLRMLRAGMNPNQSTFTSVLSACASLAILEQGKELHEHVIKTGFELDMFVGNALITMYAKCGSIDAASKIFDKMNQKNVVSWNAMIAGYAQHGHCKEALQLFEQMLPKGVLPDPVTYVGVLSACSHGGLVDEGWHYFDAMSRDPSIIPRAEHFACMVDLLGRSGNLEEAEEFINKMPFEPTVVVWKALLGGCRIHANMDLGKRAAEYVLELEPQNAAGYMLLSNIYAAAGRWDDVAKLRLLMKDGSLKKLPGCSWIEIKNKVHAFVVGDRSHPHTEKIYAMLDKLAKQMEEEGYISDTNFVLHNIEEKL